jgi:mono/diheme cytochrome c family protein
MAATVLGLVAFVGDAQAQQGTDYGKTEYEANCSGCHGPAGKGDGPVATLYAGKSLDLTTLTKRNAGVFPAQRMYEIIDGRAEVAAHGPRAMPVWGREYRAQAADLPPELGLFDLRGAVARAKIVALVDYLYRIQEK